MNKINVLFICLGNICRSPTAQGIFTQLVNSRAISERFNIDSAGTSAMVGWPPDERAQRIASTQGVDLSHLRARQLRSADFEQFDWLIVMDKQNLTQARHYAPSAALEKRLFRLLDFVPEQPLRDVIDPYHGNEHDFQDRFGLMQKGCENLLEHILQTHAQQP